MTLSRPRIELFCIGSELLSGRVNTHQSYLSLAMLRIGLSIAKESSLPDEMASIRDDIAAAIPRCDAILVCGGLGPTFDDITREAVAGALGRTLVFREDLWSEIQEKFKRFRLPIPEENRRQAFLIEGAKVIKNAFGSAPGQLIVLPRRDASPRLIALMPGPFKELSPMFESVVLPLLAKTYAKGIFLESMALHLSGIPESAADEKLGKVLALADSGLEFTILAGAGQVDFFTRARAASPAKAKARIASIRRMCYAAVGDHIFGEGEQTLEAAVGQKLISRGLSVAVAESCTGGLIGHRLTSVPGSSKYFKGGAIAYADSLKEKILGVRPETLAAHGAVSSECAVEMAQGARKTASSDLGLSITGIAGPGGGTPEKPVGLVFIAIAGPKAQTQHWKLRLAGDRETIRERAASSALHLLHRRLA